VVRILLDHGVRVQESVFECPLESSQSVDEMLARLRGAIVPEEDSVRVAALCGACAERVLVLGQGTRTMLPDVYVI
jgi:CRISPR-associated protein Cas2